MYLFQTARALKFDDLAWEWTLCLPFLSGQVNKKRRCAQLLLERPFSSCDVQKKKAKRQLSIWFALWCNLKGQTLPLWQQSLQRTLHLRPPKFSTDSFFLGLHFWSFDVDFFFFQGRNSDISLSRMFYPAVSSRWCWTFHTERPGSSYLRWNICIWVSGKVIENRGNAVILPHKASVCVIYVEKKKPLKYEWTFHALGLGTFIPRPSKANGFTLRVDVIVSRKKKKTSFTRRAFRAAVVRL